MITHAFEHGKRHGRDARENILIIEGGCEPLARFGEKCEAVLALCRFLAGPFLWDPRAALTSLLL